MIDPTDFVKELRKMMGKGGAGSRGYYARSESKPYAHPTRDARGRFARSA